MVAAMRGILLVAIAISGGVGCGDDGGTKTPDAAPIPSNIDVVTCAGGEQGPITTVNLTFAYMGTPLTITAGQTVKFMMGTSHNVVPDVGNDPGLTVDFGETKCLKFKLAGDYNFHCAPHAFKGKVTVQ